MRFVKKPEIVEAIKWDGTPQTFQQLLCMGMKDSSYSTYSDCNDERFTYEIGELIIKTPHGPCSVDIEDWIIKDVKGEFYSCKPAIFALTYESVKAKDWKRIYDFKNLDIVMSDEELAKMGGYPFSMKDKPGARGIS